MLKRVSDKMNQLMLDNQAQANQMDQKETAPSSPISVVVPLVSVLVFCVCAINSGIRDSRLGTASGTTTSGFKLENGFFRNPNW